MRYSLFQTGYNVNYTLRSIEDLKNHVITISLKTPLKFMLYMNSKLNFEIEENLYKAKIDVEGEDCRVDFLGSLEVMMKNILKYVLLILLLNSLQTVPYFVICMFFFSV